MPSADWFASASAPFSASAEATSADADADVDAEESSKTSSSCLKASAIASSRIPLEIPFVGVAPRDSKPVGVAPRDIGVARNSIGVAPRDMGVARESVSEMSVTNSPIKSSMAGPESITEIKEQVEQMKKKSRRRMKE